MKKSKKGQSIKDSVYHQLFVELQLKNSPNQVTEHLYTEI